MIFLNHTNCEYQKFNINMTDQSAISLSIVVDFYNLLVIMAQDLTSILNSDRNGHQMIIKYSGDQ